MTFEGTAGYSSRPLCSTVVSRSGSPYWRFVLTGGRSIWRSEYSANRRRRAGSSALELVDGQQHLARRERPHRVWDAGRQREQLPRTQLIGPVLRLDEKAPGERVNCHDALCSVLLEQSVRLEHEVKQGDGAVAEDSDLPVAGDRGMRFGAQAVGVRGEVDQLHRRGETGFGVLAKSFGWTHRITSPY